MTTINLALLQWFAEGAEGGGDGAEGQEALLEQQAECPDAPEEAAAPQEVPEAPQETPAPDAALVNRHWAAVERMYEAYERQAEELKQLYPEFDLAAQLRNSRFTGMLRAGVDMRTAYQAVSFDEILPAAMQYAARMVSERLSGAMLAQRDRPIENGLRSGGAVHLGGQVSGLTRQDYARICRMVERGERVSFG